MRARALLLGLLAVCAGCPPGSGGSGPQGAGIAPGGSAVSTDGGFAGVGDGAGEPGPLGGSGAERASRLVVAGSDTMRQLGEGWAAALAAADPRAQVEVHGGGTRAGVAALLGDTADLCLSSRELPPEEQELCRRAGVALWKLEVGRDGVVIAVNPQNPVGPLSLEQLRGLFSGRISSWQALGGEDRPVRVVTRGTRSGTWALLNERVLAPERLLERAEVCATNEALAAAVAADPGAVGYLGLGPARRSPGVKVLALRASVEGPAVEPTPASVGDGSYPLARPLWIYARSEPQGLARAYVELAVSPAGQALVRAAGFGTVGPGQ